MHDETRRCQVLISMNSHGSFWCFIVKIFNQREKLRLYETSRRSTHSLPLTIRIAWDCKIYNFSFTKCESFSALISWEYFCVSTIPSSSYSGVPSVLSRTFWCLLSDPWDSAHYVLSSTLYHLQLRKIATFSALKVTHSLFYNFAHIVKSILNSSYIFLQL